MKKQLKWMITSAILATTFAGGVNGSSYAADETAVYTLNPITVTATRTEKRDIDVPANVEVVTAQKIEEAGYKNAFDAIQGQLGVESTAYGDAGQDFGLSSGRTIVRGYDKGTLVMVNGIPMNLMNYNSLAGIPKDMIEKIEVVKGASGTLYGAEAMGGVVNIITKTPTDGKETVTVKGTVGNYYNDYGVTYSGPNLIMSFQREFTDANTNNDSWAAGSKYDWHTGKGQANRIAIAGKLSDEVNVNFMYNDGNITRGSYYFPTKSTTDYKFEDKRITAGITYAGKDNGIKATVGYNYRQVKGFNYSTNKPNDSNANLDSYIGDVQKKWDFGKNSLIAGYSYKRESYKNKVTEANKEHRVSNSIYLSYENVFSDKFSTTLGLRGEKISDPAKDQNVLNPQIQTLYKINDSTSWFINVGRGFQMPAVNAFLGKKAAKDELKPEKGWTYETGIKKLFGDNQSLKFSVYHMDFTNKLGWSEKDPVTGDQHPINQGDFKNTGVEIEYANTVNNHWDYSVGVGYSNPKLNNPNPGKSDRIGWWRQSAKVDGVASITYRADKVRSTLSWKYLGAREDKYKSYIATAVSRGYSSQVPALSRVTWNTIYDITPNDSLTLTLNNLFDHVNYVNSYGNIELPYNWRLSYSHKF